MAVGAHGAAHTPHGRRPAHAVDGSPCGSAGGRTATLDSLDAARSDANSDRSACDAVAAPSDRGLDRLRTRLVGLARAGALRSRARLRPLAPRRARLLPRERAAVLATRDPRVAGADDMAALDDASVSGP